MAPVLKANGISLHKPGHRNQRKWLTKGGFATEDSDDELGYEDLPWEWIFSNDSSRAQEKEEDGDKTPSRKRRASALNDTWRKAVIMGAKIGDFVVKVGDTVLLKSPEQGKDWAGIICAFSDVNDDDEEEMCAHIQWFCSPEELSGGKNFKPRSDVLPNESYITADFNMNPLTAINGKAEVMSKDTFYKKYPGGKQPKGRAAAARYGKSIICRRGVKQRTVQYTEEFIWEEKYRGPEDLLRLIDWIKEQTKGKRKRDEVAEDTAYTNETDVVQDETVPFTPRKKRKTTSAAVTPRSSTKTSKFTTPTHTRIVIKRPLEITPLGTRILSPSHYLASPYQRARSTLHVSSVPLSLPCRDAEFSTVYTYLHSAITSGTGACLYISGTPGTGKTATVREVIAQLHSAVLASELDDFNFVEINGMKVTDPHQSYALLWEALKGDRVSPSHALSLLSHEFSHPSPRRIPCVVLMDELDQLVTKNQSVMYNFFNWPALRHSRLIVLAVANTMDLPERTLSNKINSRLDLTRITFPGYTHTQLMTIISARLEGVPGNLVDPDAIQFAARKVAAVSGDARRALDICRRAVELAEQSQTEQESRDEDQGYPGADTPSKRNRKQNDTTAAQVARKQARVTISTIKAAIAEATSSPIAQCLRNLPLASKLFLAALLARSRRTGVSESTLGDVLVEAKRIADVAENSNVRNFLLLADGVSSKSRAHSTVLPRVLAMGAAAMELADAGIVAVEARAKGERARKVRLRVGEEEVRSALMADAEVKGMGFNA
jgi:origin recognition complex subunit 1